MHSSDFVPSLENTHWLLGYESYQNYQYHNYNNNIDGKKKAKLDIDVENIYQTKNNLKGRISNL